MSLALNRAAVYQNQQPKSFFNSTILFGLLIFFGAGDALQVYAAKLELNPPQGTYVGGAVVPVDVLVDTEGKSVNAVSAHIAYPIDKLEALSVGRDQSIVDLWLEEPSVDRNDGTIVFEGLILNPGFIGRGKIVTIHFRVKGTGDALVVFSEGLILANDGLGTNILEDATDARLALLTGPPGADRKLPETVPTPVVNEELLAPVVISYTAQPRSLNDFTVRGVTYPNTKVNVFLQPQDDDTITEHSVVSDAGGNFTYVYARGTAYRELLLGNVFSILPALSFRETTYNFWLTAVRDNVETEPTQPFAFIVGAGLFGLPQGIVWALSLLVALLVVVILWLWVIHRSHRRIARHLPSSPHIVSSGGHAVTPEEQGVIEEVKRDIADLEYDVEKYETHKRRDESEPHPPRDS